MGDWSGVQIDEPAPTVLECIEIGQVMDGDDNITVFG
jgi:hypothetical protein